MVVFLPKHDNFDTMTRLAEGGCIGCIPLHEITITGFSRVFCGVFISPEPDPIDSYNYRQYHILRFLR